MLQFLCCSARDEMMRILHLLFLQAMLSLVSLLLGAQGLPLLHFETARIPSKSVIDSPSPRMVPNHQGSIEDVNKLGSRPPNCHNKCKACNPCKAIPVPTLPSHYWVNEISESAEFSKTFRVKGEKYSDYKPIGWKCKCGNHVYNP